MKRTVFKRLAALTLMTMLFLSAGAGLLPLSGTSVDNPAKVAYAADSDFTIENGVLKKYNGSGGDVVIPDGVTQIQYNVFRDCTGLTSIKIPNSVTSIGYCAFSGCSGLTSITVDTNNTNYSSSDGILYNKNKTTLICCPASKQGAVTIPNSVTGIASAAFSGCTGLASITLPDSVTGIAFAAFSGCTGLTNITIPNSVTWISEAAFSGCTGLTSINIPASVKCIGDDETCFYIFKRCTGLTNISVDPNNAYFSSSNGILYNKNKTTLICCPAGKQGVVTLPNSVTGIIDCAFSYCSGLTNIYIPDSVTRIGDSAFSYCTGLTSIIIPDSVKLIANCAFDNCSNLMDVYYLGTREQWNNLANGHFDIYINRNATIHFRTELSQTTVTLSKTSYIYDGTAKKPAVTVKDGTNKLVEGTDYTVAYSNNTNVGTATVTVTGKGDYIGTISKSFTIAPVLSITTQPTDKTIRRGNSLTVSLKAQGLGLTYQWYYKKATQTTWNIWKNHTHPTETCTPNETWNGMQLYCKVKDSDGNTVDSKTIKVLFSNVISITSQPTDVTAKTGDNVTFTVKAQGDGLTYQWYYKKATQSSWNIWKGHTRASETFASNATWDGMSVYCAIRNKNGNSLDTNTVKVTLSDVLAITTQPTDVVTTTAKNTKLTVGVKGEGVTCQWYFKKAGQTEWTVWSNHTHATEWVTPNATWDGIQLYCIVTDASGKSVKSNTIKITLTDVLAITEQPSDVSLNYGNAFTTQVKAKGNGLSYQWYYKKSNQTSWSMRDGATGNYLSFTPDASWHNSQLYCKITDSKGNTVQSNTVKISFKDTVKITRQPSDITVKKDAYTSFSVNASGGDLTYQWYFKKPGQSDWEKWNGQTSATLSFNAKTSYQGMMFYCAVTDRYGNTEKSDSATLSITQDLVITAHPNHQTVNLGESLTVRVSAEGDGVRYQWYYKKADQTGWTKWNGRTHASETCTPNATWNGIQLYCEVKDAYGNWSDSNVCKITVVNQLKITSQPVSQTISLGSALTVSVKASGNGLTYQWYFKKAGQTSFSKWNGRTHASETCTPNESWNGIQLYCVVTDNTGKTVNSDIAQITIA